MAPSVEAPPAKATRDAWGRAPYRLISLSGGGYRAALYNAGTMRALHISRLLIDPEVIVNSVSGGTIPAMIWRRYLAAAPHLPAFWPEIALLNLIKRTPKGQFNWQVRGLWYWASEQWCAFLEEWWKGLPRLRQGVGFDPQILVEALDYNSGRLWLYDKGAFSVATRDLLRTRMNFAQISLSEMQALAAATAFPIAFRGLRVVNEDKSQIVYQLKDAGLIDNLAMIPFMELLQHDSKDRPFINVKEWILSDAGKPLSVLKDPSGLGAIGISRQVSSLGMMDQIMRLTGDLAQPHLVRTITSILARYLKMKFIATAIGTTQGLDEPWIPVKLGDPKPSEFPTHLAHIPQRIALSVMAEGAQAMSISLNRWEMIDAQKVEEIRQFFLDLNSELQIKPCR